MNKLSLYPREQVVCIPFDQSLEDPSKFEEGGSASGDLVDFCIGGNEDGGFHGTHSARIVSYS